MTRLSLLGCAAAALGALTLLAPKAHATVFDFAYDIPANSVYPTAVDVSGVLTASATSTPDAFLVTAITGTRNGQTITGLLAPNAYDGNDNLIFTTNPHLDNNGLSYTVASGNVNVYYQMSGYLDYTEATSGVGFTPSFTLTEVGTAVPEPSSLALLGAGLFGIGLIARRRKAG